MLSLSPRLALLPVLFALAAAPAADLFVTNRGGASILVFADDADGNVAPLREIRGPLTQITPGILNGIALDTVHDEVFVSLATGRILVFDLAADGNVAPKRTIAGPATRLAFTAGLALDPFHGELWAANATDDALLVFPRTASGNQAPLRVVEGAATGIAQPTAVFVDLDADEVVVTNEASGSTGFVVLPRSANGNVAPLRRIVGPATGFGFAVGTFRNPATGEQHVGDLTSGRVLTFAPGASGNVAPVRTLSSARLGNPAGLTLTNGGEMVVVDLTAGLVTFDPQAAGSVSPLREIRGAATRLSTPIYAASTDSPFPGAVATTAPAASVATRNAGPNPASLSASGPPGVGSSFTLTVDVTTTGSARALLIGSSAPVQVPLAAGPVVLIGGVRRLELGPVNGPLAGFALAVPPDLNLAGATLYVQAIHFGGGAPFALSNALDLTAGT